MASRFWSSASAYVQTRAPPLARNVRASRRRTHGVSVATGTMTDDVRYARNGDTHLAYQVREGGPHDLLYMSDWVIPIDAMPEGHHIDRFLRRLNAFARLILWDRRGVGQSDPLSLTEPPTMEQWIDDAIAVLDTAGVERAVLFGGDLGGQVAMLFAALHPERTSALVLVNTIAFFRYDEEHPWGPKDDFIEFWLGLVESEWGRGFPPRDMLAPSVANDEDFQAWSNRAQRRGASPTTARMIFTMSANTDLRPILPTISVPTLVLHSRGDQMMVVEHGRYLAGHIPGAKYVELPGSDHPAFLADGDLIADEVEEFVTGMRRGPDPHRVLATVLFTDIVESTERATAAGDRRWREILDRHDRVVREEIRRFRGREVKTTGDGFLATFDGPGRAIHCARAIRANVRAQLDLDIRAGLHCGEVEVRGDDVAGVAVHIAARVAGQAGKGEVVVSRTVVDLVAGSGLEFDDRGEHTLKGFPGSWNLYCVR
jgi:class 3 adenylate cyclase/alpha-beta hydrolase superfamily lysophospholipase